MKRDASGGCWNEADERRAPADVGKVHVSALVRVHAARPALLRARQPAQTERDDRRTDLTLERARLVLHPQAPSPDDLEPRRMLDKRLDLVVADARAVEPDPVERLAEQVAHEREVLARLVLVQRLELDVARR